MPIFGSLASVARRPNSSEHLSGCSGAAPPGGAQVIPVRFDYLAGHVPRFAVPEALASGQERQLLAKLDVGVPPAVTPAMPHCTAASVWS
jgi:hypothetical protein